jgi:SpoVK/Ycf46/Vps4 family AAA+-type ATPase
MSNHDRLYHREYSEYDESMELHTRTGVAAVMRGLALGHLSLSMSSRDKPNIMITGTPGTGKTSLCKQLAKETGFRHINVGDCVKEKNLHSGWDEEFECFIIDDDKV